MKEVTTSSKAIPANPRSKNYPAGASVVHTGGGNATIIQPGGGSDVDIIKSTDSKSATDKNVLSALKSILEFLSKNEDGTAKGVIDFLNGIKLNGGLLDGIIKKGEATSPSDSNVFSAIRTLSEILANNEELLKKVLRKDQPEQTKHLFKALGGLIARGGIDTDSITSELVDAVKVLATDVDAAETVSGKNVLAAAKVAGQNLEAADTVKGNYIEATEAVKGKNAAISGKTTTLNLLVQQLAEMYDLNVSHVATMFRTIIKDYISSETFIPGFSGEGMKLYKALNGDWNLEIDNLVVRKIMTVFELVISKIRAVNGGLVISPANGRIKSVAETTGGPAYYVLGIEGDMMFVADDLVRCQVFTSGQAKYYWVPVASVLPDSILILKSEFANGVVPAPGDDLVQMGNRTNTARQGLLYLTASEDGKPRFSVMDGVNSTSTVGKSKVILGCLDGMTDTDFPADFQPSGYGLYAGNVFLKGMFLLRNGKSVETEIDSAKSDVQTAKSDAQAAKNTADVAKSLADSADALLSDIANDDKLTPSEKQATKKEWESILSEKLKNDASADKYGISKVAYNSAYTTLVLYLAPLLAPITTTSNISGSTFRAKFKAYYDARAEMLNAISVKAKDLADAAQGKADDASEKADVVTRLFQEFTVAGGVFESKITEVKTDFDALGRRVGTAETTITQHTNQISLKASQSDVTALGSRVSSAEAKITPDAIKLTVKSQTDSIVSSAVRRTEVLLDATGLDQSKYYPVTMALDTIVGTYAISVDRVLTTSYGKPSWSTHSEGFSVLCRWTTNACGWGGREVKRTILDYTSSFASVVPVGSIGQLTNSSQEYIYVRGGSKYRVVVEGATGVGIILRTSDYTHSSSGYTQSAPVLTVVTVPVPDIDAVNTRIKDVETSFEIREGQISSKVSQATTSATNAKTSETNAATSASTAGTKATAAANSASDAAVKLAAITTKETSINQTASQITIQASTVTTKTAEAINAAELAAALSKGRMLYRDPTFESGANGTNAYAVVGTRAVEAIAGCPNRLAKGMKITVTGWASASDLRVGGFCFSNLSRANAIFVVRIIALIPVGRNIQNYHNLYGTGGTTKWLTATGGTGKWEEYACKVTCGASGTFSTVNHFALTGGVAPTAAAPVTWYVAYATVFDTTDVDDVPTVDEIKAGVTVASGKIGIFGKDISLAGAVTFSSLSPDTQATINGKATTGYVDSSKSAAITDARNNVALKLGYTNYADMEAKAAAGQTIITGGKIRTSLIDAKAIVTGVLAADAITATNLTVSGNSKIGGWSISGNDLTCYSENAARIRIEIDGGRFFRINDPSDASLVIRNDRGNCVRLYNEGSGAIALGIVSQGGNAFAIQSAGSHKFMQRSGEIWNAPGVLWCGRYNTESGALTSWGNGTGSSPSIRRIGTGCYTVTHNIGHTQYFVSATPGIYTGAWNRWGMLSQYDGIGNNTFNLQFKNDGGNEEDPKEFMVMIFGRNKW